MLPDDDKRYAMEICRSSESVLKKWFKINDIQLVHLLVVWWLVSSWKPVQWEPSCSRHTDRHDEANNRFFFVIKWMRLNTVNCLLGVRWWTILSICWCFEGKPTRKCNHSLKPACWRYILGRKDNIKVALWEVKCERIYWIKVGWNRVHWQAFYEISNDLLQSVKAWRLDECIVAWVVGRSPVVWLVCWFVGWLHVWLFTEADSYLSLFMSTVRQELVFCTIQIIFQRM